MLIACPACSTRYVVPDKAIGVEGRSVRCAKCRHNWFQEGPATDLAETGASEVPTAPVAEPDSLAPAEIPPAEDPPAEREAAEVPLPHGIAREEPLEHAADPEPQPVEEADATLADPPLVAEPSRDTVPAYDHDIDAPDDDEVSRFDYEPPFRPRRNRLRLWTIAAAIFAVLAVGAIGAVSYWGLPGWVPISRPTFAAQQPDLQLEFPPEAQDRRTLPNGTEFFGASGSVTNTGRETLTLPPILIVLRDARERIVYSWEVAPPQPRIAPGETVTINEAVTDVPRSARFAEIGWKPS